jgi:hypothetical protein
MPISTVRFVKSRTIQDCVAWAYEYIHQCKQSRRATIILKLDFAKSFDTVEHQAILNILRCWGFDDKGFNKDIHSRPSSLFQELISSNPWLTSWQMGL